jgi:hypothetical protein
MIKATNGEPPREFTVPSDIHFETVNPINGEIAGQWVPNRVKVALRSGQIAGAADEPSIIEAGKSGTVMSEQSISEKADQPAGEEPGKSTITEEDLPPE